MEESDTERGATVRIFIGGLGESVKEDELRNIFGSFGSVQGSVDIIRTKGRSFAYCDFIPSSTNSLTKLFGIYNGCVWKGGRLKLEKAKEHFLIRLKREWEDDSAPPEHAVDVDTTMSASVEEPKKLLDPDGQLKLFFPRLRKVKSLPLKGTGKHKYSFQRFNAPIIPKHFCDCEEHSVPPESFKEQTSKLESLYGGMDTEEINLMNSVMNKFLRKEIPPKVVENRKNAGMEEKEKVSVANVEEDLSEEEEEEEEEEEDMDDLVTNIVTTSRTATKKILRSDRTGTSKDGSSRKKLKMEKTIGIAGLDDGDGDGNGDDVLISTRGTVLGTQHPAEPAVQSRPRSIWSQKSSWKELVGNAMNDTFTVSNVLKDTVLKEEQLQLGNNNNNAGEANSSDSESSHDLVEEETEEEDDEEDTETSKSDDSAEEKGDEDDTDPPSKSDDSVEDDTEEEEDRTSEPSESGDLVEEDETSKGDDLVEEEEEEEEEEDADEEEEEEEEEEEDGTADEVPPTEPSKMEDDSAEAVTRTSDTYMNSGRGSAWRHQSSWTELLKAKSSMSFSLSGICPSQKESAKDDDANPENTQTDEQPSNAVVEERTTPTVKKPKVDNAVKMVPHPKTKKVIDGRSGAKARTESAAGEVCLFMRSSASMKDWVKSKTALSTASRKRKKKSEGSE